MGNFYKIIPESPHRKKLIEKSFRENAFIFDTKYLYKDGNFIYAYGTANKLISLPFQAKIISDCSGKYEYKEISFCYDMDGNTIQYIIPNKMVRICIEKPKYESLLYGFIMLDKNEGKVNND